MNNYNQVNNSECGSKWKRKEYQRRGSHLEIVESYNIKPSCKAIAIVRILEPFGMKELII